VLEVGAESASVHGLKTASAHSSKQAVVLGCLPRVWTLRSQQIHDMAETIDLPGANHRREQQRDRMTALSVLLFCWVLFAAVEQSPFTLQGAVVEALVERGRLYFVRGSMKESMNERVFENFDTNTPSFRFLFNIFPHGGVYHVNHAPGQFLLAAPWYAACVKLGWRFETHEHLVWRVLVWTLTAPLGALGVMGIFILARRMGMPCLEALLASMALALSSPWWPASGVLYHDSLAVALILIGATVWQCRPARHGIGAIASPIAAGFLLAFSVVTTYLVAPIVLLILGSMLAARLPRRDMILFGLAFLPTLSILPIANVMAFGLPLATGYSAGGFDKNFPSPFDLANAWEKIGFYLWHFEYGLLWVFPVFFLGVLGLLLGPPIKPPARWLLLTLMAVHFLFIITMEHHGSVGWGMGRFFLPLYPILVFGLPAFWHLEGWKGHIARALLFSTLLYSAVFAVAGAGYGLQGVMEPGVWTLKQRLMANHYQFYQGLSWVAMIAGVLGEVLYQVFCATSAQVPLTVARQSRHKVPQRPKVASAVGSRRRRRRK